MKRARIGVVSLVVGVLLAVPGLRGAGPAHGGQGKPAGDDSRRRERDGQLRLHRPLQSPARIHPAFEVRITGGPLNGRASA